MQADPNKPWDHNPKIKDYPNLKYLAVQRNIESGRIPKSFFHKYKDYNYFCDVWSNIHYGYVGKYAGFTANELLTGSNIAQFVSNVVRLEISGDIDHTRKTVITETLKIEGGLTGGLLGGELGEMAGNIVYENTRN
ncbi:polymorphic toxin type 44 domain-containing protein [Psychrobacter sp. AOP7-B1-24]|uniref:polymorphic toxin type 44 domain-containing protein n=1 Tax=Psychrobacter sp. AOP7-B1-24 TaxID=3457645 RepID=UPI00402B6F86